MRDELKDRAISLLKEAYELGWNDGAKASKLHLEMSEQEDSCASCLYEHISIQDYPCRDCIYAHENLWTAR